MEILNCIIAVPLVIIALFFVFTGWQRGIRFIFHDYQGNKRERMRDNFFSSLNIITGISCIAPIISPVDQWRIAVPITLLLILIVTPLAMLGASFSSLLGVRISGGRIRNSGAFWIGGKDLSAPEWYEYTPLSFIAGWMVFFLVNTALMIILRFNLASETMSVWIALVGLISGVTTGVFFTKKLQQKV